MKKLNLLLCCCVLFTQTFAQSPVAWEASAVKTGEKSFLVTVTGTINAGWWLYATKDSANGLDPLSVDWDNEAIINEGGIAEDKNDIAVIISRMFIKFSCSYQSCGQ